MKVTDIIESFRYSNEEFQKESILEARKNKEEVTLKLLEELNKVAEDVERYAKDENYILHFYAMYLLAEFREKRAFPIILKLITRKNTESLDALLGYFITEDLKCVLASTFDGNIDSLYKVITDLKSDEYVRDAAFKALEILQENNILKQDEVISIIDRMLDNELKEDDSIVIADIILYLASNKRYDKIETVKKLYDQGKVDEYMIGTYADFIDRIYGIQKNRVRGFIDDTIESMPRLLIFNNEEDEDKEFDIQSGISEFIDNEKILQEELNNIKKIGRNEPCHCGSGKKYKKCCLGKDETKITTPADIYIDKSLKEFPKEELMRFYDEDIVKIDEKLYAVFKHKAIPIWVERNYLEEDRRNFKNMKEALELIKAKCSEEGINTAKAFDEKIAIHYFLNDIISGYFIMIDRSKNMDFSVMQDKKVDFLIEVTNMFEMANEWKEFHVNNIIRKYFSYDEYCFSMEMFNKLLGAFPELKESLSVNLSLAYSVEGETLSKVLEPIKEFENDKEFLVNKIKVYFEYILCNDYAEDCCIEVYNDLWSLVKEFIKHKNIKTEKAYNSKVEPRYYFSNIVEKIENFYEEENIKYIKERNEFLKEAMDLISLSNNTKGILVSSLAQNYCDMGEEEKAFDIVNDFIDKVPNNIDAILSKAEIYSRSKNYEEAINVIEDALNNNEIDDKTWVYSKLVELYEECGNKEKVEYYEDLLNEEEVVSPF